MEVGNSFNTFIFSIGDKDVHRWYPVSLGNQTLYDLTIHFGTQSKPFMSSDTTRVGFRTSYLNLEPVTIGNNIAAGNHFHFEINGDIIYAKGSNIIQLSPFEPNVTREDYRYILQSALDANHNMLRVWGGNYYFNDVFYDLCDEMGILLWTETQFSDALYPANNQSFIDNVIHEVIQNARRISRHPSLAW